MDKIIRQAQLEALRAFARTTKSFALSGGTALELFYLKHRFSRDLDFFSPA
jgi:predicted nucleotidyltransferase component of viral defense system